MPNNRQEDYLAVIINATNIQQEIIARTDSDTALGVLITNNTNAIGTNTANLTQEITNRQTADTALQVDINTRALTTALTAETTARTDADTALGVLISENTSAIGTNTANLTQEITNRQTADTDLQTQINGSATQVSLIVETTARTDADTALGVLISENTNAISTNTANLTQEITNRQTADSNLQTQINGSATQVSLNVETTARTDADTALGVLISENTNAISTNTANLTQEITNRQTADSNLQTQINGSATQVSLNVETTARTDADTALGVLISENTNAISTNTANLTQEITNRQTADSNLQTQINGSATQVSLTAETTARTSADNTLQDNINLKANLDGGNTFTGGLNRFDTNIFINPDNIIQSKNIWGFEGLELNTSGGYNLKLQPTGKVTSTGSIDLTAGKEYLINGVNILDAKADKYTPCLLERIETSGTNGGSSIVGWNDIPLNAIDDTLRTDIILSGNNFSIAEIGTYTVSFRSSCYSTQGTIAEVIGITDVNKKVHGVSIYTNTGGISSGCGEITTTQANEEFKLRMYTQASTTNGLGFAVSNGAPERYAQVHIKRLS